LFNTHFPAELNSDYLFQEWSLLASGVLTPAEAFHVIGWVSDGTAQAVPRGGSIVRKDTKEAPL